jgi:hypothetical protein
VTPMLAVRLVLAIARMMLWVREATGRNDGASVNAIQASTGNRTGDAWCASFCWFCIRVLVLVGVKGLVFMRTASCDDLLKGARQRGILRETPVPGAIGLVLRTDTDAIHAFFVATVAADGGVGTVEGNTNPRGGREGYGVFERERGGADDTTIKAGYRYAFVDWPMLIA